MSEEYCAAGNQESSEVPVGQRGQHAAPPIPPYGLALASLLLGVFSMFLSVILVGVALAIVGIIVGILHLRLRTAFKGMAISGIVLSVVGILMTVWIVAMGYKWYKAMEAMMDDFDAGFDEWAGTPAPGYTMVSLDGEVIALADLRGKRVVVNCWATWCPPCRKEIPHFSEFAKTHGDEVVVIGLSDEDAESLRGFTENQHVSYPLVSDPDAPSPFGDVTSVPTTFFIDRQGIIQEVVTGYLSAERLEILALAADYDGTVKNVPGAEVCAITDAETPLIPSLMWDKSMPLASLSAGDWTGDGNEEILVLDDAGLLTVFGLNGDGLAELKLSGEYDVLELGRHPGGARLLACNPFDNAVVVLDKDGREMWRFKYSFGIDSAHWLDLEGDGIEEVSVGLNGFGGFRVLSADGVVLWRTRGVGNIWEHASVSMQGQPARIYLTEAGGSVQEWGADGVRKAIHRPRGGYYSFVVAGADGTGGAQVLAVDSKNIGVAMDGEGTVAWTTKLLGDWPHTPVISVLGDSDGDGDREWLVHEANDNLSLISPDGVRLATLPAQTGLTHGAIAERVDGPGLVVVSDGATLRAYAFTAADDGIVE